MGLARQPLHLDEGHRRGRVPGAARCSCSRDLLAGGGSLWLWAAPAIGLAFLALTGAILVWDLEHPRRFHYIFLRPQWRSWLVRGAVAITLYGGVLALHLLLSAAGVEAAQEWLAIAGIPAGVMAAVYTGYLFAQAKARDLWQSPLLAPHLLVQAILLGAAVDAAVRALAGARGGRAASSGCSPAPRSSTAPSSPPR